MSLVLAVSCATSKEEGPIKVETPARPAGQENALMLTVPAMDTVRVGFVGVGMRGSSAVERYTYIPGVKINALCDVEADRVEAAQKTLEDRGLPKAAGYSGSTEAYKELCERDDIDLVYICTDWKHHVPISLYAMEHGKNVAVEVPAAASLEDIWALINMSEKTRKHCMMLENCCYDFYEMAVLTMAQKGLLGEILHGEGSYHHNLDPFWDSYWNNWRLDFNKEVKGDVYPTHGIGPLCQALDIHRGDKMDYLVSMDTKSLHGKQVAREMMGTEEFANGDQTVTLIRTAKGKMIEIQHNVYTRRPYDRKYQLVGVDGYICKYPVRGIALKSENLEEGVTAYDNLDGERFVPKAVLEDLLAKYKHPIVAEIEEKAKQVGGHGGMDFIMDYRLIYCLRHGLPLDEDVYDAAEWSCLTELSGLSIAYGSMPVEVPDFTRGDWDKVKGFSHAK